MPSVTISEYEWQRDLLPNVCAKCSKPAAERVSSSTPVHEGRLDLEANRCGDRRLLAPLLCVLIVWRCSQIVPMRIPMCIDHRDDFAWRDRVFFRFLLPAWFLAAFALYSWALVACLSGFAGIPFLLGIPFTSIAVPIVEVALIRRTGVQAAFNHLKRTVRLSGVHADFVTAVVEDRARSRVWDPSAAAKGTSKRIMTTSRFIGGYSNALRIISSTPSGPSFLNIGTRRCCAACPGRGS